MPPPATPALVLRGARSGPCCGGGVGSLLPPAPSTSVSTVWLPCQELERRGNRAPLPCMPSLVPLKTPAGVTMGDHPKTPKGVCMVGGLHFFPHPKALDNSRLMSSIPGVCVCVLGRGEGGGGTEPSHLSGLAWLLLSGSCGVLGWAYKVFGVAFLFPLPPATADSCLVVGWRRAMLGRGAIQWPPGRLPECPHLLSRAGASRL